MSKDPDLKEIEKQAQLCHDVLFGKPGKPDESMVVIVRAMQKVSDNQAKLGRWVLMGFGGLLLRDIWTLFTNAG